MTGINKVRIPKVQVKIKNKANYKRCERKNCIWYVNDGFRCVLIGDDFRECRDSKFKKHFEKHKK